MKTVADYMKTNVIYIESTSTLLEAIDAMKKNAVSSILVKENDETIGIFTERDLLTKVDLDIRGLQSVKVRDFMTADLKTAPYDEAYIDVIDLMQKYRVRHMPVVQDGVIVGIVSLRDLLDHYYENLEHLLEETVTALSSAVEKRDPYTAGHQQRVARLVSAIAQEMHLSEKTKSGLNMAAVIHDLGKMYVPSEILAKPGPLSEAEMTLMKIHPQVGYDILKSVQFPWPVAQIVLQHHERLDGTGYPSGLRGNDILLEARIIGVADVVEAMASHRPYRPALGIDKALEEITQKKGIIYDARVVEVCCALFKDKGFAFE
ncbi:HD domain-containing phosphohydrolase [Candidatus Omnitrophota bacterium]